MIQLGISAHDNPSLPPPPPVISIFTFWSGGISIKLHPSLYLGHSFKNLKNLIIVILSRLGVFSQMPVATEIATILVQFDIRASFDQSLGLFTGETSFFTSNTSVHVKLNLIHSLTSLLGVCVVFNCV
jgi:hypothetical protein